MSNVPSVLQPGHYLVEVEFSRPVAEETLRAALSRMGWDTIAFDDGAAPATGATFSSVRLPGGSAPASAPTRSFAAASNILRRPTAIVRPPSPGPAPAVTPSSPVKKSVIAPSTLIRSPGVTPHAIVTAPPPPTRSVIAPSTMIRTPGTTPHAIVKAPPVQKSMGHARPAPGGLGLPHLKNDLGGGGGAPPSDVPGLPSTIVTPSDGGDSGTPADLAPDTSLPSVATTPSDGGGGGGGGGGDYDGGGGGGGGGGGSDDGDYGGGGGGGGYDDGGGGGGDDQGQGDQGDQGYYSTAPQDDSAYAYADATPTDDTEGATSPFDPLSSLVSALTNMLPGLAPALPVPGETPSITALRLMNLWRRWVEWGSPFATSPQGPMDADTFQNVQIAGDSCDTTRVRFIGRLTRAIQLTDAPWVRWLFVRHLSVSPFDTIKTTLTPHMLAPGRTYEMRIVARDRVTPRREDVRDRLASMGFAPMKLSLIQRHIHLPNTPGASLSAWYAVGQWLKAQTHVTREDPFVFEEVQEVTP